MTTEEMSNSFDVLYNNIASEQAAGLNEYEKSVFLTKAQDEIVKNYFSGKSKGNNLGQGFDDSLKRQADFSSVIDNWVCEKTNAYKKLNPNSVQFQLPDEVFITVNEVAETDDGRVLQIIPLRYNEYTRLMSKPFKRPLKSQIWKLYTYGAETQKYVELLSNIDDKVESYNIRYVRRLSPIVLEDLEYGLSIEGITQKTECQLDPMLHQDILQRAVELAKASWVSSNNNDNIQVITQMGQRSE